MAYAKHIKQITINRHYFVGVLNIPHNLQQKEESTMKPNVGQTDRTIRIVLGVVIIVAGVYFKSWWGVIGIVPILTAVIRWCPAYLPFGISSDKS